MSCRFVLHDRKKSSLVGLIAWVDFDSGGAARSAIPGDIGETSAMRGLRFDRLMTGTALALPLSVVLAFPSLNAQANTGTETNIPKIKCD